MFCGETLFPRRLLYQVCKKRRKAGIYSGSLHLYLRVKTKKNVVNKRRYYGKVEDITLDLFSYEELCQKMKNICG